MSDDFEIGDIVKFTQEALDSGYSQWKNQNFEIKYIDSGLLDIVAGCQGATFTVKGVPDHLLETVTWVEDRVDWMVRHYGNSIKNPSLADNFSKRVAWMTDQDYANFDIEEEDLEEIVKDIFPTNPKSDSKDTNPKDSVGVRKASLSCVPFNVLAELGVAMMEGAAKYGRHNFRAKGVRASVYYDALMRHVGAWWEGEDIDTDSGLSHVTKAIATLTVLRDAMMRYNWQDDRPPVSSNFYIDLNQKASQIVDKYKDVNPVHYKQKE